MFGNPPPPTIDPCFARLAGHRTARGANPMSHPTQYFYMNAIVLVGLRRPPSAVIQRLVGCVCAVVAALLAAACTVGPEYRKPPVETPTQFKEGVDWQRAHANPQASLSSTWWFDYHDDTLTRLIQQALKANQSIAQAEAAYRLAQATVAANTANLYPQISAGIRGTRMGLGPGAATTSSTFAMPGVYNIVSANVSASWEP